MDKTLVLKVAVNKNNYIRTLRVEWSGLQYIFIDFERNDNLIPVYHFNFIVLGKVMKLFSFGVIL